MTPIFWRKTRATGRAKAIFWPPPVFKRGITPLVATFLIIFIAIIIGTLIMTFGKEYVENIKTETEFRETRLTCNFDMEVNIYSACYNAVNEEINLVLENTKNYELKNYYLYLRIQQGDNLFMQPFTINDIKSAEIKKSFVRYDPKFGEVNKIALIPVLQSEKGTVLCLENTKEADVRPC